MLKDFIDQLHKEFDTTLSKWPHIDHVNLAIERVAQKMPAEVDAAASIITKLTSDLQDAKAEIEALKASIENPAVTEQPKPEALEPEHNDEQSSLSEEIDHGTSPINQQSE